MLYILVYGLINSFIYALGALGFTLVYGVTRIPNFAHGAVYVMAGFFAWTLLHSLGMPYWLAILLSVAFAAVIGIVIYRYALTRVRGMEVSQIILSFAVSLIILEGLRLQGIGGFKGFIGTAYILPTFVDGSINIFGISVDYQRIIVVFSGVIVLALIWLFTHYTKTGLSFRAVAQDERAALMLGINSNRSGLLSMGIGSAMVAIAAIVIYPLGNITVEAGYDVLIIAIAVSIIGGLGSWTGAILACFILGFAMSTLGYLHLLLFQPLVLFGIIIGILVIRPSGIFGKAKELEERA